MNEICSNDMDVVIDLRALCVRRGPATILDRVDWQVRRNENWVLLGANGSGKTSLLSVLAGYLTPSEGVVGVCGKIYGTFPWQELRAMLGLVSSSVKRMIQPEFTAKEIAASGKGAIINPWLEAPPADAAHALALLAEANLSAIADRPWELLSQGERQRVLICRALMADPKLMILDEPCSGLDPVARRHFLEYLEHTATRTDGPPMVLVTHHVEEITPAFTHALVLKQGRVLASGPVDEVMRASLLSEAFGTALDLERSPSGRWRLVED